MKIFRVRIRAFPSKATFYISKLKTIFKSIKLCRILNLNFDGKSQMNFTYIYYIFSILSMSFSYYSYYIPRMHCFLYAGCHIGFGFIPCLLIPGSVFACPILFIVYEAVWFLSVLEFIIIILFSKFGLVMFVWSSYKTTKKEIPFFKLS